MTKPYSSGRRRALRLIGAVGGLAVAPGLKAVAAVLPVEPRIWRGTALGAEASIVIYHPDAERARRLIGLCIAEIQRLEAIFSLYRADSALSNLNRQGYLGAPPADLVRLLAQARGMSEITGGAFDVTVQPLWSLYADHFRQADADPAGPRPEAIAKTLTRIGYDAVTVNAAHIAFEKPGMAVTLNGIAQGYITDRVSDLLRAEGVENVLIDLGEARALGRREDGRPWKAGLADPKHPAQIVRVVELADRALATSAGYGTRFDSQGRHHHLFDPASGRSAGRYLSVSVMARTATVADALSTGLTNLPLERADTVMAKFSPLKVFFTLDNGETVSKST
jgi:FAD:protein FMN transferase